MVSPTLLFQPNVDKLRFVPSNLRRLFIAGVIDSDAYFLGLQVIAKMQAGGQYRASLTMREAGNSHVYLDGRPFGGAINLYDRLYAIGALQQLHTNAGLLSHYSMPQLQEPGARDNHFTNSPFIMFGVDWDFDTKISFIFDHKEMDYWSNLARTELETLVKNNEVLHFSTKKTC